MMSACYNISYERSMTSLKKAILIQALVPRKDLYPSPS